tara:strand:+ start:228 stop:440 length:213 start_codon:yes stop_codon:yes gene_type:complete
MRRSRPDEMSARIDEWGLSDDDDDFLEKLINPQTIEPTVHVTPQPKTQSKYNESREDKEVREINNKFKPI